VVLKSLCEAGLTHGEAADAFLEKFVVDTPVNILMAVPIAVKFGIWYLLE
jgi:hypothetical protein